MRVKLLLHSYLPSLLIAILFYFISLIILGDYYSGDLIHYRGFYELISETPWYEVFALQYIRLGSLEPMFSITMLFGNFLGFEHDVYIAILNSILVFSLVIFLRIRGVNLFFIALILTNYYLFVLLTGAERLKIAYIFCLFFVMSSGRFKLLMLFISIFFHFQLIIFYFCIFISKFIKNPLKIVSNNKAICFFFTGVFLIFLFFYGGVIESKINSYLNSGDALKDSVYIFGLLLISLIFFEKRYENFVFFISIWLFAMILGGGRINMMAAIYAIYLLSISKYKNSVFFIPLLCFFSYKSIDFFNNISMCGNGFCL